MDRRERLRRTLQRWHGRRIFLTGATGFFGKSLLAEIERWRREENFEIELHALSRDSLGFLTRHPEFSGLSWIHWHPGDVRDFSLPDLPWDGLILAAAETDAARQASAPFSLLQSSFDGVARFLIQAHERQVPRTLVVSSGAVYGRQPADLERIPESAFTGFDPLSPGAAYGAGKIAAEAASGAAVREWNLPVTIARGFAFAGPYLPVDRHFAIGSLIGDCLNGRPMTLSGDGTPLRSYLESSDLALWLLTILGEGRSGEAYNLGAEKAISIAGLAEKVRSCWAELLRTEGRTGPVPEITILKQSVPGQPPARYVPSTLKAREEMGLEAWISLEEAIRKSFLFHLAKA